jgi:quercetin dioxygenase-like cupin family protein
MMSGEGREDSGTRNEAERGVRVAALGPNGLVFHTDPKAQGAFAVVEWDMAAPPAPGPPPHRHLDADEACYVLAGQLVIEVHGERRELAAGDFLLVPKGEWHGLANPGPGRARFLVILSPRGFEGYWAETADRLAARGGPLDPAEVAELQARYLMDTAGATRRYE